MKINFFDTNIPAHRQSNPFYTENRVEYVRPPLLDFDGVSVFTDEMCFTNLVDQVKSKYKIAWILESPEVKPIGYKHIHLIENKFDIIAICNADHYKNSKYKKYLCGGRWLPEKDVGIFKKTKLVSMVASNKTWLPLHKFRHQIADSIKHKVDLWGSGFKKFEDSESALPYKDYAFSIVIENCVIDGGFSEKIINCFATGTIPIYFGAPDIHRYFDMKGIITFNSVDQLNDIISNLSFDDYLSKIKHINSNYLEHFKYESPEKYLFENVYKHLI
jgi:hypothetical protein